MRLMELMEQGKRARSTYEQGAKDPIHWRELFSELNNLRRERHAPILAIRLANARNSSARFQNLVSSEPKLANKIMNGKLKDRMNPQVLRQQGSDTLLFKATDVLQETHDHFKRLNHAPCHGTHSFQPSASCNYPWEKADALDHFRLETGCWDDHIKNPVLIQRCLTLQVGCSLVYH